MLSRWDAFLERINLNPLQYPYALKHTFKHDINEQMMKDILMTVLLSFWHRSFTFKF